jgi:anti-sigma28 factor (negative regulator of flagellin synthesis)
MKTNNVANSGLVQVSTEDIALKKKQNNLLLRSNNDTQGKADQANHKQVDAAQVILSGASRVDQDFNDIELEEQQRRAEIKRQIQSGEYFANRSISDIANVLVDRMGDEIRIASLFVERED